VIAVAVGQHDAFDVGDRSADGRELALQVLVVAGEAGVDEGESFVGDDEVHGDDVVADAAQAGGEFHEGYAN
jgi:hypothetical protein